MSFEANKWFFRSIHLEKYPLLDLDGQKARQLIQDAQRQLSRIGAAELPDFLTPEGLETLTNESVQLEEKGFWNALIGNAYLDEPDEKIPSDHVRRMVEKTSLAAVGYDQFPKENLLRKIFEWDIFMNFIARVLKLPRIYRYADPMGALNLSVMRDGDYLRWHFDQTDFVTSLSVRNAEAGGEFEFVPLIRTSQSENYDRVKALLNGSKEGVVRIENKPGTLLMFQGRHSIHRVTPIKGKTSRLMGLFGYATEPGVQSSEYLRKIRYGRTEAIQPSLQ